MKKKNLSRFMALAMTGVMLCSPISVFAADTTEETTSPANGSATGSGSVEGIVNKEVFKVVLPTSADATFNFIMDPQGLIAATKDASSKHYTDKTFKAGDNLFFANTADGHTNDYSGTSDSVKVTNKGTTKVDVSLKATVSNLANEEKGYDIQLASDSTFTDDKTTSIFLSLNADDGSSDISKAPLSTDGATLSKTLDAAPEDAYEVKYNGGSYTYDLTEAASKADYAGFKSLSFNLSGSCNTNADVDWSKVKDAAPSVDVTWVLAKHVDGPTATMTAGGLITLKNLTADKNFTSYDNITLINGDQRANPSGDNATFDAGTWTAENGGTCSVQLSSAWAAWNNASVSAVITLSDGTQINVPAVTLNVQ